MTKRGVRGVAVLRLERETRRVANLPLSPSGRRLALASTHLSWGCIVGRGCLAGLGRAVKVVTRRRKNPPRRESRPCRGGVVYLAIERFGD